MPNGLNAEMTVSWTMDGMRALILNIYPSGATKSQKVVGNVKFRNYLSVIHYLETGTAFNIEYPTATETNPSQLNFL